jgi:hypothetical protein
VAVADQRDIPYVFSRIGFQVGSPSGRRGREWPIGKRMRTGTDAQMG